MKLNSVATKAQQHFGIDKISKSMAYHQAGYAAAIYLGNQQKKLPPIHFQIAIKPQTNERDSSNQIVGLFDASFRQFVVEVEGGRLIQNLLLGFSEVAQNLPLPQQAEYRCAFEADIINLLAGSLAEAKYIALRDDGVFNANLVNLIALQCYNGSKDVELVNNYMECYLPDETEREQKLAELFQAAFRFVDDSRHWSKITNLATFIQRQTTIGVIHCEEAISVMESGVPLNKTYYLDHQIKQYG